MQDGKEWRLSKEQRKEVRPPPGPERESGEREEKGNESVILSGLERRPSAPIYPQNQARPPPPPQNHASCFVHNFIRQGAAVFVLCNV